MLWSAYQCVHGISCLCSLSAIVFIEPSLHQLDFFLEIFTETTNYKLVLVSEDISPEVKPRAISYLWKQAKVYIYPVHVRATGLCIQSRRFVCIYVYIYMYVNKKQTVYYLTARKSLIYILLHSHWVKMPPVWFAKYSELYRRSNSYLSIRATWAPGPGLLYVCKAWC